MDELRLECHKRLMRLSWKIIRMSRQNLNQMGFAWNSFSVMKSILPRESVTLTEISIRTSKDSSNVTSIIDSLEDKGIIRRVSDKSDRRVIRIELTEKGIDIRNKVIEEHNSFIRDSFENVPEGMLKEFNDMLEGMSEFI